MAECPPRLFAEWMAFDRLSPIGDRRGDIQMAMIVSTIYNVNRTDGGTTTVQDVLGHLKYGTPEEEDEGEEPDPEQVAAYCAAMKAACAAGNAAFGNR